MAGGAAEGSIIYSGLMDQAFGSDSDNYQLTMEGSTAEFEFVGFSYFGTSYGYAGLYAYAVAGAFGNDDIMVTGGGSNASQLRTTQSVKDGVGAASTWVGPFFNSSSSYGPISTTGEWDVDGETAYMGFTFETEAGSQQVYGWAEIERVDASNGKLLGWAYEDSGAPIRVGAVPEPHSLALLALGAAGVGALRRLRS